jgi:hypothetical protein
MTVLQTALEFTRVERLIHCYCLIAATRVAPAQWSTSAQDHRLKVVLTKNGLYCRRLLDWSASLACRAYLGHPALPVVPPARRPARKFCPRQSLNTLLTFGRLQWLSIVQGACGVFRFSPVLLGES